MLAVGLTQHDAENMVSDYHGQVTIAAINSPSSLTLSGTAGPLEEIAQRLTAQQIFWRELKVEYAFHSAQMDPIQDALVSALADIQPATAHIPLLSTVTGDWVEGPELDGHYWWQNVRQTVRFADAISRVADTDSRVRLRSPAVKKPPSAVLAGLFPTWPPSARRMRPGRSRLPRAPSAERWSAPPRSGERGALHRSRSREARGLP